MSGQRQWSGRTDGTSWMHKSLIGLLRVTPLPLVYLLMALVVPFYLLFNPGGRRSIYCYLRRRQGWGVLHSALGCYGNHFLFGAGMLDRFAAFAGRRFPTDIVNYHLFTELTDGPEGLLMLATHIGNAEMCGYMLESDRKPMNVIVFAGEKASVHSWRERMLSVNNVRMIGADDGMEWLFTLNSALTNGEIVNIHGDRSFGSPKTLRVRLLGKEAQIPLGPFSVAAMRSLPVLASFCLKTSLKHYRVYIYRVDTPEMSQLPREEKMQALADSYAAIVEKVLHRWPLQWFNFYDFWGDFT